MEQRKKRASFIRNANAGNPYAEALISVGILAGCTLIGLLFYVLDLSEANIITIYILGILLISSATRHRIYGIISSILGVLLFNSLFAEPRFTLNVYDPQYTITILVMLLASLLTSYAMNLLRQQLEREALETRRSEILLAISRNLQEATEERSVWNITVKQLYRLFSRDVAVFPVEEGALAQAAAVSERLPPELLPPLRAHFGAWVQATTQAGPAADALPPEYQGDEKKGLAFRIQTVDKLLAVACFLVNPEEDIAGFEQNLVISMLDMTAASIERQRLRAANEQILREAEAERLRANLLRAISHDLRTPLTSIVGNADILLGGADKLESGKKDALYRDIHDEAEWLIGMVENLLFATRIENGAVSLQLEPEILQDVMQEAVRQTRKRWRGRELTADWGGELYVVRMDSRLILHVILNILDNAVKYSPPGSRVSIAAYRQEGRAVVEVRDSGGGIREEDKKKVFGMFYTANNAYGDGRRGFGLGLFLGQAIVEAHGGDIWIEDNRPQGTIVRFALQLEGVT